MNHVGLPRGGRRATNVNLPEGFVREARERGVSVSRACEGGLRKAVMDARRDAWLQEARPGMDKYNAFVAKHGSLLSEDRQF